jgi:hypothetical protein
MSFLKEAVFVPTKLKTNLNTKLLYNRGFYKMRCTKFLKNFYS